MRRKAVSIMVVVALIAAAAVVADNYGDKKQTDATELSDRAQLATITGTVVCASCDLKHGEGARADCADFGHQHSIKTKDGMLISLLENKYSKDLMGETYQNKTVTVTGVLYANANVLDVESFETDGHQKSWCESHKAMDACSAK